MTQISKMLSEADLTSMIITVDLYGGIHIGGITSNGSIRCVTSLSEQSMERIMQVVRELSEACSDGPKTK